MNERKDSLQLQWQDSDTKRIQLQSLLDSLRSSNKKAFDSHLQQLESLKQLQVNSQDEESKRIKLVEVANLLKAQNKFEKLTSKLQAKIERIEDRQRLFEDTYKEILTGLKQLEVNTEAKNGKLEQDIEEVEHLAQQYVRDKNEIKRHLKALMSTNCN